MKKKIVFGLLLCIGVATAFGQKSEVTVFGLPFGSTYEAFLSAFKERSFTGNTQVYPTNGDVRIYNIDGTFMTYKCSVEMWATSLSHTVYQVKIKFPYYSDNYKNIPKEQQFRAIISLLEDKYGKATFVKKKSGKTVVQTIDDGSAAIWHFANNTDLEVYYMASDDYCILTYGGDDALNGILHKEIEQVKQQKATEHQNQISNSNI